VAGYNPEGCASAESSNRSAVNLGQARVRNLDDTVELGTRNIKWRSPVAPICPGGRRAGTRSTDTIRSTAHNAGWLDSRWCRTHNAVKRCCFRYRGRMDDHVRVCEECSRGAREFSTSNTSISTTASTTRCGRISRRRHVSRSRHADPAPYDAGHKVVLVGDATDPIDREGGRSSSAE